MRCILVGVFRRIRKFLVATFRLPKQIVKSPKLFGDRYSPEDNTVVTLYTDRADLFIGYQPTKSLKNSPRKCTVKVSLIATAKNESISAPRLLNSIMRQTRLPDEIILIDTGSEDDTLKILDEFSKNGKVPVKVLKEAGANIARGRNISIANAQFRIIAVTDFGCELRSDWLENLLSPFEIDPGTQVVAGRYEPVDQSGQPAQWFLRPGLAQIDPQDYLPPSASIAFTKEAWKAVRGFPEWLSLTGEDTYFDLELKRTTRHWAFVPEAVVLWQPPSSFFGCWRKAYKWSVGDGEIGVHARAYRWSLYQIRFLIGTLLLSLLLVFLGFAINSISLVILAILILFLGFGIHITQNRGNGISIIGIIKKSGISLAKILGYFIGICNRPKVDKRRYATLIGMVFILTGVPIDDTGGGARSTQIALELIRRGFLIIYINKFPKNESIELDLFFRHPNLITSSFSRLQRRRFQRGYFSLFARKIIAALVELPVTNFFPLVDQIIKAGGTVIYDLMDNWQTTLGTGWYSLENERKLISESHKLVATVPFLVNRLENMSGRDVICIPNAVNSYLFNPGKYYPRPPDLPSANWYVIYIGALWGEWFDWDLLEKIANQYPEAGVIVIGDYRNQYKNPPPNLHFLGLKPQKELPAYLFHSNVAIIPWKIDDITRATSPLKVYEYIAMGKPIVAPDIRPLYGLPGVYIAKDQADFVEKVGALRKKNIPNEDIMHFLEENDWRARVDQLLGLLP